MSAEGSGCLGYYVHHVGRGHLHRAQALADHQARTDGAEVVGLSSLPRPRAWPGRWIDLPRDDSPTPDGAQSATVRGRLHWAPRGHPGLRARSAAISAFLESDRPLAVVVDVSVEVLLLARLHGVPTVGVVLPGRRDDAAHHLGFDVADALVAFWPRAVGGMLCAAPGVQTRLHRVGALSRLAVGDEDGAGPVRRRRAVLLLGGEGAEEVLEQVSRVGAGWNWTLLGGGSSWVDDPGGALREAEVVVTHAGQGALADVAAARRPAVVVPQPRPFDEQATTGDALRDGGWPVLVRDQWPVTASVLERAAGLDGRRWSRWCDGLAVARLASVVERVIAT